MATDIAKNWPVDDPERLVDSLWSILDPTRSSSTAVDNNYVPVSEWGSMEGNEEEMFHLLGIQSGTLTTTQYTYDLDVGYTTKKPRQKKSKLKADSKSVPPADHDRVKQVSLDNKADFLQALGVTDAKGKPKRAMASKLRQCQKFVEIVGNLVDRADTTSSAIDQPITVLDMGCGRGYLTFSLHSYLQDKYKTVKSVGIDMRPKLVSEINSIAQSLGNNFRGLTFEEGSIENVMMDNNNNSNDSKETSSLDVLIALHACDTATDDALWSGISRQADIIVVAPCCHKQLRPQINFHLSSSKESNSHPLGDILRHNVYRERHAEMVTDSMRALLLELTGYQVQVFEFIGGEHTAKNCMITAVRTGKTGTNQDKIRSRLQELASLHGIGQQKLAQWMGEALLEDGDEDATKNSSKKGPKGMPPL